MPDIGIWIVGHNPNRQNNKSACSAVGSDPRQSVEELRAFTGSLMVSTVDPCFGGVPKWFSYISKFGESGEEVSWYLNLLPVAERSDGDTGLVVRPYKSLNGPKYGGLQGFYVWNRKYSFRVYRYIGGWVVPLRTYHETNGGEHQARMHRQRGSPTSST